MLSFFLTASASAISFRNGGTNADDVTQSTNREVGRIPKSHPGPVT